MLKSDLGCRKQQCYNLNYIDWQLNYVDHNSDNTSLTVNALRCYKVEMCVNVKVDFGVCFIITTQSVMADTETS